MSIKYKEKISRIKIEKTVKSNSIDITSENKFKIALIQMSMQNVVSKNVSKAVSIPLGRRAKCVGNVVAAFIAPAPVSDRRVRTRWPSG